MNNLKMTTVCALLFFATGLSSQATPRSSFDLMKTLAGNWEGKTSMGDIAHVSFRLTAGDTALISEIQGEMHGRSEDMITMIHPDKGRLMLIHYCSSGNQPRMKAKTSSDGKSVTFDFVDATNLDSPQTGHMHSVTFTFVDATHHTEEWHYLDHSKDTIMRFDLQKKS